MIKVTRKFVYMVNGKEYSDQKEAQKAAQEANRVEKQEIVAAIIERADGPLDAAAAIMKRFHIYNKNEGKMPGAHKRKGARAASELESQLSREQVL